MIGLSKYLFVVYFCLHFKGLLLYAFVYGHWPPSCIVLAKNILVWIPYKQRGRNQIVWQLEMSVFSVALVPSHVRILNSVACWRWTWALSLCQGNKQQLHTFPSATPRTKHAGKEEASGQSVPRGRHAKCPSTVGLTDFTCHHVVPGAATRSEGSLLEAGLLSSDSCGHVVLLCRGPWAQPSA